MSENNNLEKIPIKIFPDEGNELSIEIAKIIGQTIKANNNQGKLTVLGLATGSTPLDVYRELIRLHQEESLSFGNVITFNLDEYYGLPEEDPRSYHSFMQENLFNSIDIKPENIHIPNGLLNETQTKEDCQKYEQAIKEAGGIDIQILGIGRDGHIGFNEPGSGLNSRTRLIALDKVTRKDALPDFGEEQYVPTQAITMGVATILEARKVILIARGDHKAKIIQEAVEGSVTESIAASYLQNHPNAAIFVDQAAASELTKVKTPWLVNSLNWNEPQNVLRAVFYLSQTLQKPLKELEAQDFKNYNLEAITKSYNLQELKEKIISSLQLKIKSPQELPKNKKIVIFSPHPDDDSISLGGTIKKLVANSNSLTIVYMTPGYNAVFDHDVENFIWEREGFNQFFNAPDPSGSIYQIIRDFLQAKKSSRFGLMDIPEVLKIKTIIRMVEAMSSCQFMGVRSYEFLEMPFYKTGSAKKMPVLPQDIALVKQMLDKYQPDIIFAANDLNDPNGTHRLCLKAIKMALAKYKQKQPELWLYRGAWQELHPMLVDVFVPLSEAELMLKREAIFRHQSQKDKAPQPGASNLEFWQRSEQRNTQTAKLLELFGLAGYYALEAFQIENSK